ncbi:DUF1501 domain-containing protein [Variovorax sp. NFACC27]|uniref:DUF1501 domain-containing protein n=1 Tax=unclassified Variovorax TaxID=663243 RepID=UPI000897B2E3|nr:uncharacterized protein (DUF1501 family) [Variovorax paradoxus]SEF27990.1 Uncharacterized conserved protein, DUF1501 family [Variovorax sp. NFACC28]SEG69408.1 Uncharacterized conserved protein, DUF1501 family [Variovorax sp. NFACC29]SFC84511.1 Uncharacterized conserved protein, DUF1501 family [Variovorax sp. NFACC26]SFF97480.1 Uncharacterized conserved protein, DUF1501 family [Variovorax sp. NFACC27]
MHLIDPARHTRRAFLRRSGQLAMAGTALPFALNLAAMGEAAAQAAPGDDYKALVCVFLFGGNDYANTLVNFDTDSYTKYSTIRGAIALPYDAALAATELKPAVSLANGRKYALNPAMTRLTTLFDEGKMAVQLNVGPLVKPLTRAQFNGTNRKDFPIPPKLFSHNDQQSIWQSSSPEGSTIGWGGNLGDLMLSGQRNASLFTCISVAGNAVFLSGDEALQYQVGTRGAVRINSVSSATGNVYGSSAVKAAMQQLAQQARGHTLENEYNKVTLRAVEAEGKITTAIQPDDLNANFPTSNNLADQLKMVARLIRGRTSLGVRRQVFFVSMGGYDLHDDLDTKQGPLMQRLSEALFAFQRQMEALGVSDKVTAFTASDFGRTLSSNGNGSDHGWGSHHFVVGGANAVKGKAFYGTPPPVSVGNTSADDDQWHVGQGRLLPTTSVDQYAATLAKWFGVPDSDLNGILPNLKNFNNITAPSGITYLRDMGFMA